MKTLNYMSAALDFEGALNCQEDTSGVGDMLRKLLKYANYSQDEIRAIAASIVAD